jgi:uncharacterized protein
MDWQTWELRFRRFLDEEADPPADPAHDWAHVERVVRMARRLTRAEGANLAVVVPAAWLHDCAQTPKDTPERRTASAEAARRATVFLDETDYPAKHLDAIGHAIEAHSFSAGVAPRTLEAQVVQDADRLDALGAVGIARCFAVGGALGHALYDPDEPLPRDRAPDDDRFAVDHFFEKLLSLAGQMQTGTGHAIAEERTAFMRDYLDQFEREALGDTPAPEERSTNHDQRPTK